MSYELLDNNLEGGAPRTSGIPTNIPELMSPTSSAGECFVNQRFSGMLQAFMVGYVNSIYSNYSVYEE